MSITSEVLENIKPSKADEKIVGEIINWVLGKINSRLKNAKAVLGGSGAKGTWLRDAFDVDIFVMFNYKDYKKKTDDISNILEQTLKKVFPRKVKRLHGSRDYFQIVNDGLTFEIVPILNIRNSKQAENITDVSPLHCKWVRKHKKYSDEIRLTKQFCKANNIYGAESYIMGFSGYICEILTVYYKSFMNLLKNASKWKPKVVIDIEKYHKNPLDELNQSKLVSPIVIIDPVQDDRNAAAVVSYEKLNLFISKAKEFLKKPSKKFFENKKMDETDLLKKHKGSNMFTLEIKAKRGKEDVVGCKILKTFNYVKEKLIENDFEVKNSFWDFDRAATAKLYFVTKKKKLSDMVEKTGPSIRLKKHSVAFKKKHKKTFVKKGKLYALDKRKYKVPETLVKDLLKDKYIIEKVKSVKFKNIS